ncbi:MAG: hypothetical protein CMJ83_20550 [Planctomycetes bacterium]|nr:hypothetical protein [Planctomycetota bacterium]
MLGHLWRVPVAIGVALVDVLAVVTLVNSGLEMTGRPAGWFWVDLRSLPDGFAQTLLIAFGIGVLGRRWWSTGVLDGVRALAAWLAVWCFLDAQRIMMLADKGLASTFVIPMSLPTALLLLAWAVGIRPHVPRPATWRPRLLAVAVPSLLLIPALLAHALVFGETDYRRAADAAVVFGARVHRDGAPSLSLADRVRTGVELYHAGLVRTLVLSGAHGDDEPICETEAMRRLALEMGVPEEALVLDPDGRNTLATVRNARDLSRERGWRSLLLVSHDWHLARIKLFGERQGLRCYTVPVRESRPLTRYRFLVAREAAALLYYWLHPGTFAG